MAGRRSRNQQYNQQQQHPEQHKAIRALRELGIKWRPYSLNTTSTGFFGTIFGCPVDKVKKCTSECCGLTLVLPEIVKDACEILRNDIHIEGLFRKGGSQNRQKDIKSFLENGGRFDKTHHAIDIASLLKTYLRSLPEPIIGTEIQEVLLKCIMLSDSKKLQAIQWGLLLLPVAHLHILHYIMEFLSFVSSNRDENKMDANNLAIVIAPSIMPPPPSLLTQSYRMIQHITFIQLLIENPSIIGNLPVKLSPKLDELIDKETEVKIKKKRRSGSLTRVFSGFKKIVSGGNLGKASSTELLNTPVIKENNKRKQEPQQGLSAKKRKEVLNQLPLQVLTQTPLKPMNEKPYEKRRLSIGRMSKDKLILSDNSKKDAQISAISGITYRNKTENTPNLSNGVEKSKENDYVRISKSEYEDIKNRVSAIENKISEEFHVINKITHVPVTNVQCAYEKTLEEAAILNSSGSEQLAKRLSRELKIRRSDDHKIIRSPSARKIENLKRRSQEHVKLTRTQTWNVSSKTDIKSIYHRPKSNQMCSTNITLKRGRPNTLNTGLHQPSLNSNGDAPPLIDIKRKISLDSIQTNKEIPSNYLHELRSQRSSSFHGDKTMSKSSSSFSKPVIPTPDKSNTSNIKWTNASTFLSSAENSHNLLTGRASVAKLRSQNAGMVMAKARLFDGYSDSDNSSEKNLNPKETRNKTSFARKPRKHSTQFADSKTNDVTDGTDKNKTKELKSQLSNYRNNVELSSQLKEVIYDTCTPVMEKLTIPINTHLTPKKNEKMDAIFKTPRATPPIRKPLSEKAIKNMKLSHIAPARKLNTPVRANHAIPRRQSPRLISMKSRIMQN